MGYKTVARAKAKNRLVVTGSRKLETHLQTWLGLSPFAKFENAVA